MPVFVSSLKDAVSVARWRHFRRSAAGGRAQRYRVCRFRAGRARKATVLEHHGAVVLQVIFSGSSVEQWRGSDQGLSARDLAMNVALPEVDGRVLSRAVSFKSARHYDEGSQANIVTHEPMADRVEFVAALAANWARLRAAKPASRRVALIMANYPNRDGRLGNGVGLDTPAGTWHMLHAMREQGYRGCRCTSRRRRADQSSDGGSDQRSARWPGNPRNHFP